MSIPLPDTNEVPPVGSPERDAQEREAYARAAELIYENDGRLRGALDGLEWELEDNLWERIYPQTVRDYARALVDHVEQCWATDVIAASDRRKT